MWHLQSLNPFYVLNECLGPALCRKVACCCSIIMFAALMIFLTPFMDVVFALPTPVPHIFVAIIILVFFGPPIV